VQVCARIDRSSIVPAGDALKGGGEVGSRVHVAASTCLVLSGLFLCGLGGALAIADPSSPGTPGGTHTNNGSGTDPADSDASGSSGPSGDGNVDTGSTGATGSTGTSGQAGSSANGNGGNPNTGNCGNAGSNGNAQGCGGGTTHSSSQSSSSQSSSSQSSSSQSSSSQSSSSQSSSSQTSSSQTSTETSTQTSTETSTETTETTTPSTTTSPPGLPGPGGGGGGGGGAVEVPSGRPELAPQMQLPPELMPPAFEPSVIDVVPGIGAGAAELPVAPITLPVIVAPAAGLGGGGGAPGAPRVPSLPSAPRRATAEPPAGREPLPANVGSNAPVSNLSYRIGYGEFLRTAGLAQVAALAVPGVTGILVLTGAGGLVGYRQAKAGHAVRTGTARFVN
jgi:hypothetical protein